MVQLEISNRYQSREGLLKFLRERFGDHINFNITETADGHFKFEAPENLTKEEWSNDELFREAELEDYKRLQAEACFASFW
ncbi:hypothetical protein Ptr902_03401 [Pyrenophora tritici-repentis]|nr:hypothetical protein TUN199_11064 [Pyrenophora tritici-repentis]KAI2484461.1 hypothetical protein Ptr902_03401 [Pyrenophora tritici-repentis]